MAFFTRRIVGLSRLNCAIRYESSLKSTVVSDARSVPNAVDSNRSQLQFPWRERPDVVESSWAKKLSFDTMRKFLSSNAESSACFVSDKMLVDGASSAFIATLNGIFQHNLVDNVCLKDSNEEKSNRETVMLNKEEVPLLNDVLEAKLAQFYENAILKCSIGGQELGYMLRAAEFPEIVNREIIIGSCRHKHYSKTPVAFNSFAVTFVVDNAIKSVDSFDEVKAIVNQAVENGFISVRYWVDIPCEGND